MFNFFRTIGYIEGVSFLVLLGVAMPLKYFAGLPLAVKLVGWLHGLLFILYIMAAASVASRLRWDFKRICTALLASLIPFGTFIFDRSFMRELNSKSGGT